MNNIGRGLASVALFGLAALMLYYKIDACGMGLLVIIGLCCIWNRGADKEDGFYVTNSLTARHTRF